MATITGYTAARMQAIEDGAIVDGDVVGDNLILRKHDGSEINAGSVRGPQGVPGPNAAPPTRQIFTTPGAGTYNRPDNCVAILVELIGGGGAGGPANTTTSGQCALGGGGGGGAYAAKLILSPSASYSFVVGDGGAASTYPTAGGDGADTTFGTSLVKADGGSGGLAGAAAAVPTPSGGPVNGGLRANCLGDLIIAGELSLLGLGLNTGHSLSSKGGAAAGPYGGKASAQLAYNGQGNGVAGSLYGGGGGGGQNLSGQGTARQGGPGGPGIIVVTEFYG